MNVVIFDINGKLIAPNFASEQLVSGVNSVTISLDNIPAGSYVLRIVVGEDSFIKKLTVIK